MFKLKQAISNMGIKKKKVKLPGMRSDSEDSVIDTDIKPKLTDQDIVDYCVD